MNPGKSERGSVFMPFIFSVSTIALIFGMLVESSVLLTSRNKMFNDAEHAVLAAANLYVNETKNEVVLNSLIKDGYTGTNYLEGQVTSLDFSKVGNNIMQLNTEKTLNLLFYPNPIKLTATVAASIPGSPDNVGELGPLVMEYNPNDPFIIDVVYTIKQGGGAGSTGNYGGLSLGGNGADNYLDKLKSGFDGVVSIGDWIPTETGNMNGPTKKGVDYRLANGMEIIVVALTDNLPNGKGDIEVQGFAAFKIIKVDSKGAITGKFIKHKISAGGTTTQSPNLGLMTKARLLFN